MEDNIDLDDDDYTKSNELTEDRKNALKKIMKKIIKEIHQKPYLLRQAMAFKDWKIKSGIKQEQNDENNSKINLNIILKKDGNSKEKKRTVFKNKIKTKYNIIINKNNNLFNKTINNQYISSKIKNISGKELFIEPKKKKSSIRKMVTE